MANFRVTARIKWLSPATGGRQSIPQGNEYTAPACFEGRNDWTQSAYSLALRTTSGENFQLEDEANAGFLVPHAPVEWLVPGARFSLYEGRSRVLEGVVIGPKADESG